MFMSKYQFSINRNIVECKYLYDVTEELSDASY